MSAVWPVKLVRPSAPSKLMCRSSLSFSATLSHPLFAPAARPLVATVESYAPLMARAPKTFNSSLTSRWCANSRKNISAWLIAAAVGPLATTTNGGASLGKLTLEQLEALNAEQKARTVLVCRTPLPAITMRKWWRILSVCRKIRFPACVTAIFAKWQSPDIKGFLNRFAKTAKKTADFLTVWRSWGCQWWASIRRWYFVSR